MLKITIIKLLKKYICEMTSSKKIKGIVNEFQKMPIKIF
jgi:hypothetical protein